MKTDYFDILLWWDLNRRVEQIVGYKEWEMVCQALAGGEQTLLLRRGGIHEGRAGFSFKHERFFLFPTRFHAQAEQVRRHGERAGLGEAVPGQGKGEWELGDRVPISCYGEALWAKTLTDWDVVRRLEPHHVWIEDVVRERYECGDERQIHCALVRIFTLPEPWVLTYARNYGGCRTWVNLPEPAVGWKDGMVPVLGDDEFAERRAAIEGIVG